jgi:hypothetical protein
MGKDKVAYSSFQHAYLVLDFGTLIFDACLLQTSTSFPTDQRQRTGNSAIALNEAMNSGVRFDVDVLTV